MTVAETVGAAGLELGTSGWRTITQEQIDGFAAATGDEQWIHVDRVRAAAGPFGQTIAHGYLLLSLLPSLAAEVLELADRRLVVNYGVDRIRFTAPVPAGSRVRLRARLVSADPRGEGVLLRLGVELELEGSERPALAGETLSLAYGGV
jgi:acyl dehydratase